MLSIPSEIVGRTVRKILFLLNQILKLLLKKVKFFVNNFTASYIFIMTSLNFYIVLKTIMLVPNRKIFGALILK